MKKAKPQIGDLRVWHIPQVPMHPFFVTVSSVQEAKNLLPILWDYDKFQYENNIKPDYSNVSGLEIYVEDDGDGHAGWNEWEDEEGENIRHYIDNNLTPPGLAL